MRVRVWCFVNIVNLMLSSLVIRCLEMSARLRNCFNINIFDFRREFVGVKRLADIMAVRADYLPATRRIVCSHCQRYRRLQTCFP